MKLNMILTAVAATALMSGAAYAQATDQPAPPTTASTPSATPAPTADPTLPAGQTTTTTTTTPPAADTGAAASTSASTTDSATGATVVVTTLTNGPIPDTPENRAKYGAPMSRAGKHSPAKGN